MVRMLGFINCQSLWLSVHSSPVKRLVPMWQTRRMKTCLRPKVDITSCNKLSRLPGLPLETGILMSDLGARLGDLLWPCFKMANISHTFQALRNVLVSLSNSDHICLSHLATNLGGWTCWEPLLRQGTCAVEWQPLAFIPAQQQAVTLVIASNLVFPLTAVILSGTEMDQREYVALEWRGVRLIQLGD